MSRLLEHTMNMLEETDLSVPRIARAANVQISWLYKLKAGKYSNPGVVGIEAVHDVLKDAESAREDNAKRVVAA